MIEINSVTGVNFCYALYLPTSFAVSE